MSDRCTAKHVAIVALVSIVSCLVGYYGTVFLAHSGINALIFDIGVVVHPVITPDLAVTPVRAIPVRPHVPRVLAAHSEGPPAATASRAGMPCLSRPQDCIGVNMRPHQMSRTRAAWYTPLKQLVVGVGPVSDRDAGCPPSFGLGTLNRKPAPKSAAEFGQFHRFVPPIC